MSRTNTVIPNQSARDMDVLGLQTARLEQLVTRLLRPVVKSAIRAG